MLLLPVGQRTKPGTSQKKCSFGNWGGGHWIKKYFHLVFTLSSSKCEMVLKIANCYCMFLMQPSRFQFFEINLAWIRNGKFSIFISSIVLILIFILFESEGRAGEDWEPSKEVTYFLPPSEDVSYVSLFFLSSALLLYLRSLSVSRLVFVFKGSGHIIVASTVSILACELN